MEKQDFINALVNLMRDEFIAAIESKDDTINVTFVNGNSFKVNITRA